MPATLEIKNVSKKFSVGMFSAGKTAVRNLTLHVHPGEVYGLIGPNGSGKTTTIKMVAGLLRPGKGSISVGGFDIQKLPTKAKRLIGYVPDNPDAYDFLTGREFLQFVGSLYGMDAARRDDRIATLLEEFGVASEAGGFFGAYSRGVKQKFAMMAGLLHSPELLLIDEPMVGLDPAGAAQAVRTLRDFSHRGGSILMSTHSLGVAEELCHRVGILSEGTLLMEDRPAHITKRAGVRRGGLTEAYLHLIKRL